MFDNFPWKYWNLPVFRIQCQENLNLIDLSSLFVIYLYATVPIFHSQIQDAVNYDMSRSRNNKIYFSDLMLLPHTSLLICPHTRYCLTTVNFSANAFQFWLPTFLCMSFVILIVFYFIYSYDACENITRIADNSWTAQNKHGFWPKSSD